MDSWEILKTEHRIFFGTPAKKKKINTQTIPLGGWCKVQHHIQYRHTQWMHLWVEGFFFFLHGMSLAVTQDQDIISCHFSAALTLLMAAFFPVRKSASAPPPSRPIHAMRPEYSFNVVKVYEEKNNRNIITYDMNPPHLSLLLLPASGGESLLILASHSGGLIRQS